ncbi:MAG: tryptophan synthase subunit alpha [Spirochaetes bacterium RBG_13_51_14]|nr:MAG: tryptophan synthase subunit alpha [Spirochaetes bacterium RBG_13_51_14]
MKGIYLAGGYPDTNTFRDCFHAVATSGFDFIEVGIPFNDPIADGPVIARAIHDSLGNGVTPDQVMNEIHSLRNSNIKKYVMTYANIIYSYGIKKFSDRLTGLLNGIIIPDLPNRMAHLFHENGLDIPIVPFATLETRESDLVMMNRSGSEIVYFIGVRGITGAQSNFESPELVHKIRMIKENTDKKVVIGFGIKTGEDARQALKIGDGFVVGTEAVRRQRDPEALRDYLRSLCQ